MGFGLLFIGYAIAFPMALNSFGFLFRLIGMAIITHSTSKLKEYETSFAYPMVISAVLQVMALAEAVFYLLSSFDISAYAISALQILFYIGAIAFHFVLYRATGRLASSLDLQDIVLKCAKYGVFIGIEIVLIAVSMLLWYLQISIARYLLMASFILPFLIFVMNLALIYSCYKNICEEGCEDIPRKPSKFAFLNRLMDVRDKREEEIFEKTKSYAENRIRLDNEKKKNKKKKKK